MDVSIFLAKALSIYLFVASISMLLNASRFQTMIENLSDNIELIFITGFMALIIGILMVVSHNIWEADWRVVVTIIGWLSLVKGVVRVLFPQLASEWIGKFMDNNVAYYVTAFVTLLLSLFLAYFGFVNSV